MAAVSYGDFPPGFRFGPTDEQIIELYLLPRVRGQPDLFFDLIIDDDSAANTQPWNLFRRHGLSDKFPAFFFVRTNDVRPGARPNRVCQGGGAWKSMKREGKAEQGNVLMIKNGEEIRWTRHNLNFNMGSGSVGWVMHEYTILSSPSLKLYQISLSGHCKKRMRSSDDCLAADEPAMQRPRESGSSLLSASWMTSSDQGMDTTQACQDQEPMVEEMTGAQQPNWAFQDQVQIMEQPSASWMAPTPNQELAYDFAIPDPLGFLSPEEMAEMYSSLAELPAIGEPYQQQFDSQDQVQISEQPPASSMAPTPNQDPANDFAIPDPLDILSPEEIAEMYNSLAELQDDGLFDEQVSMEPNKVDEDAVMPSFCDAQDTDGLFTLTEGGVECEGMLFC